MVKNLRMLRENMGLSQEKLAVLTGLTARRVFSYEREPNEPDIETLALLADFFGVTIDFLVGHTEDEAECAPSNSLNLTRFGVRIRQFRESKSMERPELAKRVGVTSAYLGLMKTAGRYQNWKPASKYSMLWGCLRTQLLWTISMLRFPERLTYYRAKLSSCRPKNSVLY